ncbi:MAG: DUF1778 domain-containing protein [Spirochaetaceae bacterium]|nr:MAG: DUF1778 domain-containing protein [Spirochaetaceae bacterium]
MATRSERIELRAKPEVKAVIERAAQLRHTTVSAYLLETAFQRAQSDLKETETLVLSEKDRTRFFALIDSPPEPNSALRSLFRDSQT